MGENAKISRTVTFSRHNSRHFIHRQLLPLSSKSRAKYKFKYDYDCKRKSNYKHKCSLRKQMIHLQTSCYTAKGSFHGKNKNIVHVSLSRVQRIPHICQFWYTTPLLKLCKSTPRMGQFRDKIVNISQKGHS